MTDRKEAFDIDRYFPEEVEYPAPTDYFKPGTFLSYISSTFLNGWINYVDIIAAWYIDRYESPEANRAAYNEFLGKDTFHTKLASIVEDDIIVLGVDERGDEGKYWFFWFDRDSSDCCMGAFLSSDGKEEVMRNIESWLEDHPDAKGVHKVDHTLFKGWISW